MTATVEGRLIGGRYRLESLLGKGGMAAVWRAVDTTLERRVAVKLLHARDARHHEHWINRFKREARIAAAVRHPNVVSIVDFGTTEEHQPFMVMEMLNGQSLGDRLECEPTLTLEELVRIAASTLRGLGAVHAAGITHKDIKPDNIFLHRERDQTVTKILDFGISSVVHADGQRTSAHTIKDGVLVGTPEYMSPEQIRGSKTIDLRADIYSMGVVLYEAIVGKLPFESENTSDLIVAIVKTTAPPLDEVCPDLPRPVAEVIRKAMAHKPEQRFSSAAEMREALLASLELGTTPSDMPLLGKNEKALRDAARAAPPVSVAPNRSRDDVAERNDLAERDDVAERDDAVELSGALASPAPVPAPANALRARGTRPFAWLAAAMVMVLAGLVLWLSQRSSTTDASVSPHEVRAETDAPPAPSSAAVAPAPPPPSVVAVELRGVPDLPLTADGGVSLPKPRLLRANGAASRSRSLRPGAAHPGAPFEPPKSLQRIDF